MTEITEERLAELQRLHAEALSGPSEAGANAAWNLVARIRDDLPSLIATIRGLRVRVAGLEAKYCPGHTDLMVPPETIDVEEDKLLAACNEAAEQRARAERAEADAKEAHETIARVWKALGIETYKQAAGKSIDEHLAALRQESLRPPPRMIMTRDDDTEDD